MRPGNTAEPSSPAKAMEPKNVYMVMMENDSEYERFRADRCRNSSSELDVYVSKKHDMVLQKTLEAGTYRKHFSWVIVDGFTVEITSDQAEMLRGAGVRAVVKNWEIGE